MKAVLISIRPKWVELIASGKKTVEVRKTRPKLETPFRCYIYCTSGGETLYLVNGVVQPCNSIELDLKHDNMIAGLNGYVAGEFVCDRIFPIQLTKEGYDYESRKETGMGYEEMAAYLDFETGYGWHISALNIYDTPRKLSEFRSYNTLIDFEQGYPMPTHGIKRPPQSYMYVEELTP